MNPADLAAAAATPETSIFEMFWSAHIVVKAVMLGLFLASLWCWTIIFDKTRLFHKFKNEMENFEQIFWSGQSLEELYTSLSNQPNNTGAAALFVAAMREWKRSFQQAAGSFRGLHARIDKVLDVSIAREVERLEFEPPGSRHHRLGRTVHRPVRHGVRHHELVSVDRGVEEHFARRRCARHRRSAAGDGDRPLRRDSGADRL